MVYICFICIYSLYAVCVARRLGAHGGGDVQSDRGGQAAGEPQGERLLQGGERLHGHRPGHYGGVEVYMDIYLQYVYVYGMHCMHLICKCIKIWYKKYMYMYMVIYGPASVVPLPAPSRYGLWILPPAPPVVVEGAYLLT